MPAKGYVVVSDEMVAFWGPGSVSDEIWPKDCVTLAYFDCDGGRPLLRYAGANGADADMDSADVLFVVQRAACARIFGSAPAEAGSWHLPSALRLLVLNIRDCLGSASACNTLRLGRSIELLCQTFPLLIAGDLLPSDGVEALGELDVARIAAARRLIDERWHQKHTLASIARTCGLNRDKLARGFRTAYRVTVTEALATRRLEGARDLLLTSDLPVAAVGHHCGYLNKASFARAFGRHFGFPPTELRRQRAMVA